MQGSAWSSVHRADERRHPDGPVRQARSWLWAEGAGRAPASRGPACAPVRHRRQPDDGWAAGSLC